ncbi:MAG TPA: hypothetical protein DCX07_13550 [Phycisphaerales bacterium]|nr:hypothetical protein [Phycisphaerales bacterium]
MSRTLPPRPDLTQLKHQAKDLLHAHERKDADCCSVLRRLRQFASADDAGIFSQPLALHEAQYALAMEYGFASWNAMKRYVEKVTGRPSPVRREKDRTYIAGLEKHPIGGDGVHENSVLAAIAGIMQALGEDELTYEYLVGVSGAAFRVQMHQPNWCPSAACAPCGYDCVPGAMAATGYRLTWLPVKHDPDLEQAIVKAAPSIRASIERGVPVLYASEETCLAVGYRDDGQRICRNYASREEGYHDTNDWPWVVGVIEPSDAPPDRREAVANSLRLAVTLARTERFGKYLSGFAALQYWIDGLRDESRFAGLNEKNWFGVALANGYCYGSLWSSRLAAEKYLREAAEEHQEPARTPLLQIAALYRRIHETLGRKRPEYECAWSLQPWRIGGQDKWTPQMRHAEAEALKDVLDLEQQAVAKIEAVAPLLAPAPKT